MRYYRTSQTQASFHASLETVWNTITNLHDASWRSDLESMEVKSDKEFIEHVKGGIAIHFTIHEKVDKKRYSFQMKTKMWVGEWYGDFSEVDGKAHVVFTEKVHVINPIMRLIAGLFMNLKKMQETYINDLRKRVE